MKHVNVSVNRMLEIHLICVAKLMNICIPLPFCDRSSRSVRLSVHLSVLSVRPSFFSSELEA